MTGIAANLNMAGLTMMMGGAAASSNVVSYLTDYKDEITVGISALTCFFFALLVVWGKVLQSRQIKKEEDDRSALLDEMKRHNKAIEDG